MSLFIEKPCLHESFEFMGGGGKESEVWPIIYGTGDMTEVEFLMEYNKNVVMGGGFPQGCQTEVSG